VPPYHRPIQRARPRTAGPGWACWSSDPPATSKESKVGCPPSSHRLLWGDLSWLWPNKSFHWTEKNVALSCCCWSDDDGGYKFDWTCQMTPRQWGEKGGVDLPKFVYKLASAFTKIHYWKWTRSRSVVAYLKIDVLTFSRYKVFETMFTQFYK
jgi:hypothetical protein